MDALHVHRGQQLQAGENRQEMSKVPVNCAVSLLESCSYANGSSRLNGAQDTGENGLICSGLVRCLSVTPLWKAVVSP